MLVLDVVQRKGSSKCFISRGFGNGLMIGLGFELQLWEFLICLFVWHQANPRAFHTLSLVSVRLAWMPLYVQKQFTVSQ
jgi:hypothetical protein